MRKVLIVEDDLNIQELLNIHLLDLDCEVTKCADGKLGLNLLKEEKWDLLILDIMLPSMNGLDICKEIRQINKHLPILMLTAKSEEIDKIVGLELGADDYLIKPFSIRELIARVKALFRRAEHHDDVNNPKSVLVFSEGVLQIDLENRKILLNNERIEITPIEFKLLVLLAKNKGKSYSRERLLNLVWGYEFLGYEHTVNSHINRLRAKIEVDASNPKYILTTWGIGYRFSDEI